MYDFRLGRLQFPVAPSKLSVKINNNNQTLTLINEGEINILKSAGLTEISFTVLLPNVKYPFALGAGVNEFLDELERIKNQRDVNGQLIPCQFVVTRTTLGATALQETDISVSLEDYKINESYDNGFDTMVDINLKQYKPYNTKLLTAISTNEGINITTEEQRPGALPASETHTVIAGDSLWAIAKKYLGNGNRYPEIYELNKTAIDERNKGTGNVKYTIYPNQIFIMPVSEA